MKYHILGAFLAFAAVLLISAMAPSIDKGIDTGKLWQAAHERAVREGNK